MGQVYTEKQHYTLPLYGTKLIRQGTRGKPFYQKGRAWGQARPPGRARLAGRPPLPPRAGHLGGTSCFIYLRIKIREAGILKNAGMLGDKKCWDAGMLGCWNY